MRCCSRCAGTPASRRWPSRPATPAPRLIADQHAVDIASGDAVVTLARQVDADLVVIGPEVPLVLGVADAVRAAGIACFGPSRDAARIEGSKAFAKDVMAAAGVRDRHQRDRRQPRASGCRAGPLRSTAGQRAWVVKDDGLAAGKGVVVTADRDVARAHAAELLEGGHPVLLESFLDGPEVSLFCVVDGETVVPLLPAQDFKRVGDGDTGPNTGGMGAYAPLPWLPAEVATRDRRRHRETRCRGNGPTRLPVLGAAVRGSGDHVGRTLGGGVQLPLRRSRDPVGAGPAGHPAGRIAARRRDRRAGRHRRPALAATAPRSPS